MDYFSLRATLPSPPPEEWNNETDSFMTNSIPVYDELILAEVVAKSVTQMANVRLPTHQKAFYSTVGRGARIAGIAVQREHEALDITIELVVTMNTHDSLPALAHRVRQHVRKEVRTSTSEPIRWINIRISEICFNASSI